MEENNQIQTTPPSDPQEEKELQDIKDRINKKYRATPKYMRWYSLFTDKDNKQGHDTFGNATKSTLIAYNLDRETQYDVAMTMGSQNLRKLKDAGRIYLEGKGVTFGKMIDIGFNKMLKSPSLDPWFMFMDHMGLPTPEFKPTTNVNYIAQQTNQQFNAVGQGASIEFISEEKEVIDGTAEIEESTGQIDESPIPDSNGQTQVQDNISGETVREVDPSPIDSVKMGA